MQVAALTSSLLIGVALLIVHVRPPSLQHAMPGWVQTVWCAAAIFAGGAGLAGTWLSRHPANTDRLRMTMFVELLGVFAFSCISTMDTLAVAVYGAVAIPSALFAAAFAVGGWWRCAEIVADRRKLVDVAGSPVADVPLLIEGGGVGGDP